MAVSPEFLFLSQATSPIFYDLVCAVGRELGPALLISGTEFSARPDDRVTVWAAPKYDNSTYASRMRTWSAFVADALVQSRRVRGQPVVVANSNPPFGPWLAYSWRRLRGWRYVARILDVYPDAAVGTGLARNGNPAVLAWQFMNRKAYDRADAVVTLGPVMRERVRAQMSRGDVEVIPSWVNAEAVRPIAKRDNAFAREHGLSDGFTIVHSGNLGITHDISGLLDAAASMTQVADVRFLFVGGGARAGELAARASRLSNMRALPHQPAERVPQVMATGDVGLVVLGRGAEGVSMPSKASFMMAAGCALLGLSYEDNDLSRLIDDHRCGVNVRADDPVAIRAAIDRFRSDPAFLRECQSNARRAAEETFSARACIPRYIDMLRRIRARAAAR